MGCTPFERRSSRTRSSRLTTLPLVSLASLGCTRLLAPQLTFGFLRAPRSRYISIPCSRKKCHRLRPLLLHLQHPLRCQCLQCPLPLRATRTFRCQSRRQKRWENSRREVLADSSPPTMYVWQHETSLTLHPLDSRLVTKLAARAHQPELVDQVVVRLQKYRTSSGCLRACFSRAH